MSISHADPSQFRPMGDAEGSIRRIEADRLAEAVERLTASGPESDPAHARRFIRFAKENRIDLGHFWGRFNDAGRILHSVLCVPSPGRTCMVFSTNPTDAEEVLAIAGVVDHACRGLRGADVDLAQALLEPSETFLQRTFLEGGFHELAMLSYLERPMPTRRSAPKPEWASGVSVEPFRDDMEHQLIELLDRTYAGTLDCPGLFGLRRTEDILAGHRASGEFDPELWTILRLEGRAVGVILLNPSPASRTVELVYMGIAPEARGRGLGTQLLNHGLSLLAGRREHNVTLAVDENNRPAQALYRRAGFRPVLRRRAMIRSLRETISQAKTR